jgi:hypothetical protein
MSKKEEKKEKIPTQINIDVYYYIDDETDKPVFDFDSMIDEFHSKIEKLENKFAG